MSANVEDNRYKFYIKLYYEFGGSVDWLREEIIKKRYDSLRYLLPVKNKEKYDIVIEIYSFQNKEERYISITGFLKFVNIISLPKVLCKDLKISSDECKRIYGFLKETYFEE